MVVTPGEILCMSNNYTNHIATFNLNKQSKQYCFVGRSVENVLIKTSPLISQAKLVWMLLKQSQTNFRCLPLPLILNLFAVCCHEN